MAEEQGLEMRALSIDCGECIMQRTNACEDCVVSYILDPPGGAIAFDAEGERALRTLTRAGLVPEARFERKTG